MRIPLPLLDRELVARAPNSLHEFSKLAWGLVEPVPFVDNWHIGAICERLQAVSAGEIKRLVINIPPGTTKSLTVSVFWPLWEWIERPATKWMFASYDASLSRRDGLRMLKIIQDPWWERRWETRLTDPRPSATDFQNTDGGFRFSTSVAGKATGRHSDIQVVDDPSKPKDVSGSMQTTRKAIESVSVWWRETMSSRRSDPETFRRVIVMQRLNEDDLAGEMLREGGYDHLCLPMRYERTITCVCGRECSPEDKRREDGELLCPERFPESVVQALETREMGPSVAAAQLQQRPTPASGGIIQKSWFRYWHVRDGVRPPRDDQFPCVQEFCKVLPERKGAELQSWDMTFKGADGSDFVAGGVWLHVSPDFFLLDQVCSRLSFIEACQALLDMSKKHPRALTKLIEDKANGPAIEDTLKKKVPGIVLVNPQGGKEARLHAVSGLFQAGNVYLPHPDLAPWVPSYRVQLSTFPRGVHDDMVDQTSQALLKLGVRSVPFVDAMRAVRDQLGR